MMHKTYCGNLFPKGLSLNSVNPDLYLFESTMIVNNKILTKNHSLKW